MDPDAIARAVADRQDGVVTLGQARRCGLSADDVRTRVRRGHWRRVFGPTYLVDADCHPEVPWRAQVRAAVLLHGPSAVVGLSTAARLHGLAGLTWDPGSIDLVLPRGRERHQRSGIALHWWPLRPGDAVTLDGLPVTSVPRTLADLVPRLARRPAISLLDSALNLGLAEPADLEVARATAAGRPGAAIAADWWACADGRAQSPLETWVRLDCADGGVPPDTLQLPVRGPSGVVLGYGDLGWTRRRRPLVGEADGAGPHGTPVAVYRDRSRANAFTAAGVDLVRFTWSDALRVGRCAGIVRHALASAS